MSAGTELDEALGITEIPTVCTHSCPTCCEPPDLHPVCFWKGCNHVAVVEGWHQNVDGMGFSTGQIIMIQVCKEHTYTLIGYKKGK